MELTPREKDKLLLYTAALVAERRLQRGVVLNYPETIAYISMHVLEGARDGKTVAELMSDGRTLLNTDQVMPEVPALLHDVQIEATFPDGTKLVTIHDPIQPPAGAKSDSPSVAPGAVETQDGSIEINAGRDTVEVDVSNTGDRPIQVGSHFHFFEVNSALAFERDTARGYRLNIPAGTAVRFEPGQNRKVELVALAGERKVYGFNQAVMGSLDEVQS